MTSHSQRFRAAAAERALVREAEYKAEIIQRIINDGRVCYRPSIKPVLVERHTTYVLVYGTESEEYLKYKIENALNYQGSVKDYEVLHALSSLNPGSKLGKEPIYEILGLYLYLADQVSLHPNNPNPDFNKSFLKACRDNGFELAVGEKTDDLKQKFINVLKDLGLYQFHHIQNVVDNWCMDGCFVVQGETHNQNGDDLTGAYVKLAAEICKRNDSLYAQISDCISYALGNKEFVQTLRTSESPASTIYRHTQTLTGSSELVEEAISKGYKLRFNKIKNEIDETFGTNPQAALPAEGRAFFEKMLAGLSLPALKVLESEQYLIAYATEKNINSLYPKGDEAGRIPGYNKDDCNDSRISPGTRLSRYFAIMFADGIPPKDPVTNEPIEVSQEDKLKKQQHLLRHETMHIVLNSPLVLSDPELSNPRHGSTDRLHKPGSYIYDLKERAAAECQKIYENHSNPELNAVLDKHHMTDYGMPLRWLISRFAPTGYSYTPIAWQEEILCNLYALGDDLPDLPELQPLKAIQKELETLVERVSKKIEMNKPWEERASSSRSPQSLGRSEQDASLALR